jgi:hypothetical protein
MELPIKIRIRLHCPEPQKMLARQLNMALSLTLKMRTGAQGSNATIIQLLLAQGVKLDHQYRDVSI